MGEGVPKADDLTRSAHRSHSSSLPADTDRLTGQRWRASGQSASRVRSPHPHVCRVFDIGTVGNRTFLTMEFVDGEDLATLLRRIGRLPAPKAVELGGRICAGLAAAHEQGVLHRDLKPANIMVDGHGRATSPTLASPSPARRPPQICRYPAYMPELLAGHPASTRSDIYALGLVLRMFTGDLPFRAVTLQQWHGAPGGSFPIPPSTRVGDIDPLVERMILACLEKDRPDDPGLPLRLPCRCPAATRWLRRLPRVKRRRQKWSPQLVVKVPHRRLARRLSGVDLAGLIALLLLTPYSIGSRPRADDAKPRRAPATAPRKSPTEFRIPASLRSTRPTGWNATATCASLDGRPSAVGRRTTAAPDHRAAGPVHLSSSERALPRD